MNIYVALYPWGRLRFIPVMKVQSDSAETECQTAEDHSDIEDTFCMFLLP